ncbi:MAG: FG-GAP repeat domain-containing protein, partial [Verrucomicrobiota bacterium]
WSDLEGDGYPELILAVEWGPIRVFRNQAGRLVPWDPPVRRAGEPAVALSTLTGWWNSVAAGDFDGDGRLDLVAGNWGENTGYRATPARPLRLHYGDLAGGGLMDLVEGWWPPELSHEVPRRGWRALGLALPPVAARYASHAEYSRATLAEVLAVVGTPARRMEAVELRSLVWLNRGDHWLAQPLPLDAQLAPVFGLSVADVDGDGHEDLLGAQNFHAFRLEWPRPDAGRAVVLLGDGQGGFASQPASRSGVRVDGEQRGAAVADFDGDGRTDWVDTQVGAATRLFRNTGASPGLRVRLRGPAGNPAGYGAVLQRIGPAGAGPAREVRAASGYGSVDSPVPVLSGPGDRVRVRWPGGAVSETAIPSGATALEIPAPPRP